MTLESHDVPDRTLVARIERTLGKGVLQARRATGGYTAANRWVLQLDDGHSVFAKSGIDLATSPVASWLRVEYQTYASVLASFMPQLIGWDDDGAEPVLLLEDLSAAHWPPPWSNEQLDRLRATLDLKRKIEAPSWMRDLEETERGHLSGWERVQDDPSKFLSLGLATNAWLDQTLPALIAASRSARLSGDSVVHLDMRSDNICFADDGVKIIDWNHVGRGNPDMDLVFLLPSLHYEGGPRPWDVIADTHGLGPLVCGYFAAQAGQPRISSAPMVREVQRQQLLVALPWTIHELSLPRPDGPRASEFIAIE